MTLHNDSKEPESMFKILDFARCHGRKISKDQVKELSVDESALQKVIAGEYLRKIEKDKISFYTLTSKGLNLFGDFRKEQPIPEDLREQITETLSKAMAELETKPWEVMFHIIHLIGKNKPVTARDVLEYFQNTFPEIKGISKPNIYKNMQHLRMKGYIEYGKQVQIGQSEYRLSKKGEEIFYMTQIDAIRKLRTSEEWDKTLRKVYQRIEKEREQDDEALFYVLDHVLPSVANEQYIWALYVQANVYEARGNLDKAEETYLHMEGICEDEKDSVGRAYALKGLGNVAFKEDKHSVARQYYRRCKRIAQSLQDNLLLSDVLNNIGSCLYMDDAVDEALQLFEEALALAQDDKSRKSSTLYNEGLCYARKEDLAKARELWLKSLSLYEELQENIEIKKVKHNLREIDKKQKREYLEDEYRRALQTGTTEEIEKAYKALVRFLRDGFIRNAEGIDHESE